MLPYHRTPGKRSNQKLLLLFHFVSDVEVMPEEEAVVTVGAVQWELMSYHGLEQLLNITHLLFTKVRTTSSISPEAPTAANK